MGGAGQPRPVDSARAVARWRESHTGCQHRPRTDGGQDQRDDQYGDTCRRRPGAGRCAPARRRRPAGPGRRPGCSRPLRRSPRRPCVRPVRRPRRALGTQVQETRPGGTPSGSPAHDRLVPRRNSSVSGFAARSYRSGPAAARGAKGPSDTARHLSTGTGQARLTTEAVPGSGGSGRPIPPRYSAPTGPIRPVRSAAAGCRGLRATRSGTGWRRHSCARPASPSGCGRAPAPRPAPRPASARRGRPSR